MKIQRAAKGQGMHRNARFFQARHAHRVGPGDHFNFLPGFLHGAACIDKSSLRASVIRARQNLQDFHRPEASAAGLYFWERCSAPG